MPRLLALIVCLLVIAPPPARAERLLPADWDPKAAADKVLAGLVKITAPEVKGAHDAEMAIIGDRAFVVAEVNDRQPGEAAAWDFIYSTVSVVDLRTLRVEKVLSLAKSGEAFANEQLPVGAIFVPRILKLDERTVRCYFASEQPGKRQAQTYYRDLDAGTLEFAKEIHRVKLRTADGVFDMQPRYFHADAARQGFKKAEKDFGLYLFDSFKEIDGRTYVALNNYPGAQNALAVLNDARDTVEVLGHYNGPGQPNLTESAVNRLPDGTWMAICRQENGSRKYWFCTSRDGRTWTTGGETPFVGKGAASKPTFDRIGGLYYLGWQESTRIDKVGRSVFNVDVSKDGVNWERKYRFETAKSFQYPVFREHRGTVWLAVTQGDTDPSRKERIMFGRLE